MSWFRDSPDPATDDPFCARLRATLERWDPPERTHESRSRSAAASIRPYCSPRSRGCSSSRAAARGARRSRIARRLRRLAGALRGRRGRARCAVRERTRDRRARLGSRSRGGRARGALRRARTPHDAGRAARHRSPRRRSARDATAAPDARHGRAGTPRRARARAVRRRPARAASARVHAHGDRRAGACMRACVGSTTPPTTIRAMTGASCGATSCPRSSRAGPRRRAARSVSRSR